MYSEGDLTHCLLCYELTSATGNQSSAKSAVLKESGQKKCHFGNKIDLIHLCDVLRVSVNEAEKYFGGSVSLCNACDTDIRNMRKLLLELKTTKSNLSKLMKVVKMKLDTSFSKATFSKDHQAQLHLIRNEILFDLNTNLGFTELEKLHHIKNEQPDISSNYESAENDAGDLLNDQVVQQTLEPTEALTTINRCESSTAINSKIEFSPAKEKEDEVDDSDDQEFYSEKGNSDPDFLAGTESDEDESDEEYVPPGKSKPVTTKISTSQSDEKGTDEKKTLEPDPVLFPPGELKMENDPKETAGIETTGNSLKVSEIEVTAKSISKKHWNTYCAICDRNFYCKKYKLKHMLEVHGNETWKCMTCGKVYKNQQRFDAHLKTHAEDFMPHICSICGKTFHTEKSMRYHEKFHSKEELFPCPICPKKWKTKFQLQRHMEGHSVEPNYTCDQCGKTFKYTSHFQAHIKLHTQIATGEETARKCEQCGKMFKNQNSLCRHKSLYHPSQKIIHQCNICGKILTRSCHLKKHQKIHQIDQM